MGIIRYHQCFVRNAFFSEPADQIDALYKGNIAIIVSMNDEYRRFPGTDVQIPGTIASPF